jgi:hypothetical protein
LGGNQKLSISLYSKSKIKSNKVVKSTKFLAEQNKMNKKLVDFINKDIKTLNAERKIYSGNLQIRRETDSCIS